MTRPFPVILSSPSGGGKTTITKRLLAQRDDLGYSVSATTRAPRAGETNGRDYFFLSADEFEARRGSGEFAESAGVHGRLYGTLRAEVARVLGEGRHVMMDIDVQGARQFARAFPESVRVFILPPDGATMVDRLGARNSENADALRLRLRNAVDELHAIAEYDYVVVNDDLDRAVARVGAIIDAEAARRTRQPEIGARAQAIASELERQLST